MRNYLAILQNVLDNGRWKDDRTGTGTKSVFEDVFRHDMRTGFPLPTTKKLFLRGVFEELIGFLKNDRQMWCLLEKNVKIWDDWRLQQDTVQYRDYSFSQRLLALIERHPEVYRRTTSEDISVEEMEKIFDQHAIPKRHEVGILPKGTLNAPYGPGWRGFQTADGEVDQFAYAMELLEHNPDSRRILVSAWNPGWMPVETREVNLTNEEMWEYLQTQHPDLYAIFWPRLSEHGKTDDCQDFLASHGVPRTKVVKVSPQENVANGKPCLTPCHWAFEFYTEELDYDERMALLERNNPERHESLMTTLSYPEYCGDVDFALDVLEEYNIPKRFLDLKFHMRSVDTFLGLPFNIASYALLLQMVGAKFNMVPRMLVGDLTNVHIYRNHIEQVKLQLSREPRKLPTVQFTCYRENIEDYVWSDVVLQNYNPHEAIKGDISK